VTYNFRRSSETEYPSFFTHTTSRFALDDISATSNKPLDLELSLTNARSFVPMYLGRGNLCVREAHARNTFSLAPTSATVELPQARELSNARTNGNRLDRTQLSDDLEVHALIVANASHMVNHARSAA
jgi:hypothetical protein